MGLAAAIVGVGNALSLCSDAISMKLENCTTYTPGLYHDYATTFNCTDVDNYECEMKQATCDVKNSSGGDGQTLPTVYKHAINNVCTYADSPAYACGEY